MDISKLATTNFVELEKSWKARGKKGKEAKEVALTPEESKLCADKEAAKAIALDCCKNKCKNSPSYQNNEEICEDCYAVYQEGPKRFKLARYSKA